MKNKVITTSTIVGIVSALIVMILHYITWSGIRPYTAYSFICSLISCSVLGTVLGSIMYSVMDLKTKIKN